MSRAATRTQRPRTCSQSLCPPSLEIGQRLAARYSTWLFCSLIKGGWPALIATALLGVGAAIAETNPEQARTCLRESRELSTALGYQKARGLVWATAIAFLTTRPPRSNSAAVASAASSGAVIGCGWASSSTSSRARWLAHGLMPPPSCRAPPNPT